MAYGLCCRSLLTTLQKRSVAWLFRVPNGGAGLTSVATSLSELTGRIHPDRFDASAVHIIHGAIVEEFLKNIILDKAACLYRVYIIAGFGILSKRYGLFDDYQCAGFTFRHAHAGVDYG